MAQIPFGQYMVDEDQIMYENIDFYLIRTLGGVAPGHVMIVPKNKMLTLSEMDDELYDKFLLFKEEVTQIIRRHFSEPFFLEYGRWGQSVEQAHLHIIPLQSSEYLISSIFDEFVSLHKPKHLDGSIDNMKRILKESKGYVYIEERGKALVCHPTEPFNKETTPFHYRYFFSKIKGVSGVFSWKEMDEEAKRIDDARGALTRKAFKSLQL